MWISQLMKISVNICLKTDLVAQFFKNVFLIFFRINTTQYIRFQLWKLSPLKKLQIIIPLWYY